MTILNKYRKLNADRRKLVREAFVNLVRSWFLVRFGTFKRYSRDFGEPRNGEYLEDALSAADFLQNVRWAIETTSRPFGDIFTCLMKAMAGKAMLNRRGIRNTITLGAKVNHVINQNNTAEMQAHAWLNVGAEVLLGAEEKEKYTPVTSYTGP